MPKTWPIEERTRTQLQRLKWGMLFAPLLLLAPYEVYNLLVVKIEWQEALLDVFVVLVGSFALTQFAFSIIFRLYDRSMQQRVRLATLHQVDVELSASLDQKRVLEAVLEGVLRLTPAQGARIFTYDAERREFAAGWERLASGEYCSIDYRPRPDGFNARVVRTGELLVIEDTAACSSVLSAEDLARGIRAAAGIPLLHGDQVLGVLSIGFGGPHTFTEGELETLRLLGNRAAVALDNARQYQRAEAAEARFRDVALSSADWVWEVDAQGRYTYCSENVVDVLGYTPGEVLGKTPFEFMPPDEAARVGQVFAGIAADRQPIVDLEKRNLTKDGDEVMLLTNGVPILDSEGYLLGYRGVDKDITERKRAEEEIKRRGEELEALREISLAVTAQLEPDEVLQKVVERGCRLLEVGAGGIYLVDEERGDLELVVSRGYTRDYTGTRLAPGDGLGGKVLQSGASLAVDDYRHWEGRSADWETEPLTAVLGVPLKRGEQVIGVLEFAESGRATGFDEHDVWLATLFANQAAIAIENARLYQAEQDAHENADTLREISRAVGSTLELDEVLSLVLRQTKRVLTYDTASILLFAGGEPAMAAVSGYEDEELVRTEVSLRLDDSPILQAMARDHRPTVIADVREDERWIWVPGTEDIRAWIGVPLLVRDEMVGALMIDNTQPGFYTEADGAIVQALANQAAVAIENARLYQAEQRGREVAEVLQETARVVNASLNLDEVLPLILEQLAQVIHYDSSTVLLLGDGRFKVTAGRGFPDTEGALRLSFSADEDSLSSAVVRARRPLVIEDVQDDPRWQPGPATAHIHGWIGAPLIVRDRVTGVLAVDSRRPGAYSEEDGQLVFAFANQAAVAIENARLYEETQRRASQAALAYEVGRRVSSKLELSALLSAIVTAVYDAFDYYGVMLMLLDKEAECLTLQSIAGGYADIFPKDLRLAIGEGMIGYAAATGETQVSGDVSKDPHYVCKAEEVTKSELAVPIESGQEVIGVLDVQSDEFDAFGEMDVMVMETLADHIAVAIENARLFEETRRRVRELRLLHDVGLAASSGVRLEETLQAAAVALAAELGGNNVALMLLDAESGTLRMAASVGYPPGVVKDLHLRLGEGITGWVAQHGEPALVPDVRLDLRYYEGDSNTRSELCVPLAADSRVIGVLNVESPQPHAFTEDDQRLLSTLASNLTVLIERARLFEEVEAARNESQQRAEALEEANVRLRELDRLKSEFLANMSHELRTPLNSVIGFSEVLIDGLVGEVTSDQEECLENIRSSGKHLLALINDILDLSKIEAGRVELKMATFDVAGLLAEVEVTIRPLIEKKSQVLKIERAEGLPLLTADRFRVKQVLLNLISNAYKFTLVEGHITLSCRLVDQTTMLFSVTDTGIGIKPEDQRIIFEEFRQADGSAAREMTGTGLGLAISKRLVEMHGGRLWVESEYGHGATFSVLLPLDGSWAPEAEAAEETALVSEDKTVLVVEDDRQFSNLLAFYLRQEGYTPVQHYNGVGVLDKARELKPALITLDIMLPDQDGWEVLRALKSDPQTRDVPVLVISVLENSELAFSLGAVDYMVKPIGRDDLHRLLDRLAAPDPLTRHVTVLAVDDDPGAIKLLQQMLPADSCTLLAAYDGERGLSLARSEHPDVILLDLLMPGMNGFEVLEALRADAETADIPVFVLTAKEVTEGDRELLNDHIQGLMRKGALTPKSLLAELRRLETLALQPEGWTRTRTPQAGPEA